MLALFVVAFTESNASFQLLVVGKVGLVRLFQPVVCLVGEIVVHEECGYIKYVIRHIVLVDAFLAFVQKTVGIFALSLVYHYLGFEVNAIKVQLVVNQFIVMLRLFRILLVQKCHASSEYKRQSGSRM